MVVIRQIDDGADTARRQGRTVVFVIVGAIVLIGVVVVGSIVWTRYRRSMG